MIVDVKITGTLAKGAGCLIIFEDHKADAIYPSTIKTISKVVDSMFVRSVEDKDLKVSSVEFCLFYPFVAHSLLVLLTVFFFPAFVALGSLLSCLHTAWICEKIKIKIKYSVGHRVTSA